MVIGITGGIGAGKSQVVSLMEKEFGAAALIADEIARQLTEPGHSFYEHIVDEFGQGILLADGTLDRAMLAEVVFAEPLRLKKLNQIVHPMVKEYIKGEISCLLLEDPARIIVVEAALLIEDHYDEICDELWYIYADEAVRRKRLKESRRYTDEKITSIMERQLTDREFRENCQRVIDNSKELSGTLEEIKKALEF